MNLEDDQNNTYSIRMETNTSEEPSCLEPANLDTNLESTSLLPLPLDTSSSDLTITSLESTSLNQTNVEHIPLEATPYVYTTSNMIESEIMSTC